MKIKIHSLKCPSCGAGINMDLKGRATVFCPFCGSQFAIDDGSITINKNINIQKRYTNDADVEKQRRKDRANEREYKTTIFCLVISFLLMVFWQGEAFVNEKKRELDIKKNIEAGMIQVGEAESELEGRNYKSVVEQLEAAGFTEIKTIDLDDAGLISNKADTVESVSIGGNSSFGDSHCFSPDAKVVISYH